MNRFLAAALICMGVVPAIGSAQERPFYLHDGDKVVFYGDSITEQRLYTMIVETYAMTRFPTLNVDYVNSGWGGDRVSGGGSGLIDVRLQRDVIAYKPTVVTVMLGMNDGGYKAPTEESDKTFFDGMRHIVDTIRKDDASARITLIQPSPYDDVTRPPAFPVASSYPYNNALIGYGNWLGNYGSQNGMTVADANTPFVEMLKKAFADNAETAKQILPDHVHPAFGGHLVLAGQLLKAWAARPVVTAVTLDVKDGKIAVEESQHSKVTPGTAQSGFAWTQLDQALPLPFVQWGTMWGGGPTVPLVISSSNLTESLNEEPLRVTGLTRGVYGLRIDGKKIGTFSSDSLATGINLATMQTPMTDQAFQVYQAIVQFNDVHFDRFKHVQVALEPDKMPEAERAARAMDEVNAAIQKKARALASPKPHRFELVPVS